MDKILKETTKHCKKAIIFCTVALLCGIIFSGGLTASAADRQADRQEVIAVSSTNISQKLIPLGRTTGIKLFSEGAMIVGFAPVCENTPSPANEAGLVTGDIILKVNGISIASNEDLISALAQCESEQVILTIKRGEAVLDVELTAAYDQQSQNYKIGAWVRDSMAGIGTITFVDPKTGAFGALGHGICDVDTGELMPFASGSIMNSTVSGVVKGAPGAPGELSGSFDLTRDQGVLHDNTSRGIFGQITDEELYSGQKAMELAKKSEIKTGKAYIISNVQGDACQQYEIEIMKVYLSDDEMMRDMMIKVCDERLISVTGGIVQGMSGSPIVQNGKIIGAVTHVLVNDPLRGYGISIERMVS